MAMRFFLVLAFCIIGLDVVVSYKMLAIFHTTSHSHYFFGSALMKGLAAEGHEVTVISPFKEKDPIPNYTEVYLDGTFDSFQNGKLNSMVISFSIECFPGKVN